MLVTPTRLMAPAPGIRPSIRLGMASGLDSRITFTRASAGSYFDGAGALQSAATDVPRFDYDASGNPLGLLVEASRTNLLLNNATLSTQSVTVAASQYTLSFYGTGTVTLSGVSTAGPLVGTGAANRVPLTFTPTAGSLTCTVSGTVTNAQLELGAFASSIIPTTGTAATRQLDLAKITTLTPWFNAAAGTIVVQFSLRAASGTQTVWSLDDGTGNERYTLRANAGTLGMFVNDGNVQQALLSLGSVSANTTYRVAFAYAVNDFAASINGAAAVVDTAGTLPTVTQLVIGSRISGTEPLFGWVGSLSCWPYRIPNAQLQTLR